MTNCSNCYKNGSIPSLYVLKALCAISIVFLHTPSLFHEDYLIKPFSRIAVPLFFMITGYFLSGGGGKIDNDRLKRRVFNVFKLIIVANSVYALFGIIGEALGIGNYINGDFLSLEFWLRCVFSGDCFSSVLWYLTATFWALILIWFLNKVDLLRDKALLIIIPFLIIAGLLLNRYSKLVFGIDIPCIFSRNAIFMALPYILLGHLLHNLELNGHLERVHNVILPTIVAIIIAYMEFGMLFFFHYDSTTTDVYLTGCPLSICIFMVCLRYPNPFENNWLWNKLGEIGKNHSKNLYLWHKLVLLLLYIVVEFSGISEWICCPLIVIIITMLLSKLIVHFQYLHKKRTSLFGRY